MEDDHLDGRARVAMGCAVLSLVIVASPGAGVFFGLMGSILASASVIAVDEPAGRRTRRVALIAGLISALVLAAGVIVLYTSPQGRE